jgi:glycosyltransferase involved in cell wall biosynthesis
MDTAGDRRRLIFWAEARGHSIVTDLSSKVDVVVASENADFNSSFFEKKNTPIIFDLVDAYLSPLSYLDDTARGIAKRLSGQISGGIKPFSHHVRDFCKNSALVICSSIEQEEVINRINTNTCVILDSHDEIPFIDPANITSNSTFPGQILWEGQPATIRGIKQISPAFKNLSKNNNLQVNFITDQKYYKLLNKYFEGDTSDLLGKNFHKSVSSFTFSSWTPENLFNFAKRSRVAIIPIDLSVPMQALKPENRLLIMWRLGLPCLTSASPAYIRVANDAGVNVVCENLNDWASNLNQILNDPKYALSESIKGQNYLREHHNRKILLRKWDNAIQSVLG